MKLKFLFIICVVAAITACDDNIPKKLEFEQFKKLYLSTASDQARRISLSVDTRDTSFVFGNVAYGGTTDFQQGDITVEIGADFSLVEAYNAENSTQFKPLPDTVFTLNMNRLVIENGKNHSGLVTLSVRPGDLDIYTQYLLPVTIKSSDGNLAVNDEKKTAFWSFVFGDVVPEEVVVVKDIYPLRFRPETAMRLQITDNNNGTITLASSENDPYVRTSTLGRPLSEGAHRVIAFDYKSNRDVTNAQFFFCVSGQPASGVSTGEDIPIPQADDWTRFEFDLTDAIDRFGFGVNNSGGNEPSEHFLRFDPIANASDGFELIIRNFQIEVFD